MSMNATGQAGRTWKEVGPRVIALVAPALMLLAGTSPVAGQALEELEPSVLEYVSVDEPTVALVNVQVVDGTGAPPADDQTVLIRDGRIEDVGSAAKVDVPSDADVVDGEGHTVLPGLVGMHNHTFYTVGGRTVQLDYSSPRLYLGTGVTTIRTTGAASPFEEIEMKEDIDRGGIPGPRMHVTGPYITGGSPSGHMQGVATPEEAREFVDFWADEGATWFKAYTQISPEALEAAIEAAHERGLRFTGHLCSVSFTEAVEMGIDNLEHGLFTNSDWHPDREPGDCPTDLRSHLAEVELDSPEVRETIGTMVDNEVPMSSTLAIYELLVPGRPPVEERFERAMHPDALEDYLSRKEEVDEGGEDSHWEELFRKGQEFERMFVEAGGLLGAGVDPTGMGGALPGFGDQRNYELFLEAGFEPAKAVEVLTLNGARILGEDDERGSVEPGKWADLVLIDGDPVERPEEIRDVVMVFRDGIGYDSEALIRSVDGLVGER